MATILMCLLCGETFEEVKALAEHMVAHQAAKLGE